MSLALQRACSPAIAINHHNGDKSLLLATLTESVVFLIVITHTLDFRMRPHPEQCRHF